MKKNAKSKNFFKSFGLGKEKDYFLESLSALLGSGMPIFNAISAIKIEIKSKRFKKIVENILQDINDGSSLAKTLENSGIFSKHVSSLVRIGEQSGKLIENLKIISIEQKKENELKLKLRSAIMYPVFVLSLTFVIGIGIAWFILPKLAQVFSQLKVDLPTVTKILIDFGLFLNEYGAYFIPGIIVFISLCFYFIFFNKKTKFIGEFILFKIPGVKKLIKELELARFGYLFGTLLSAGLSPTDALQSLSDASSLGRYKVFYLYLKESINDGNSFKKSFSGYKNISKIFPASVQQLIVSGEQSGTLSETLIKIGENYQTKTDTTAKDLTVILEPILLVIVWLGVLAVAFAVILPIYSLVGGLNVG